MHAIDKIPNKYLRYLTLGILKLSGMANTIIQEAQVFDDDEFQPYNFGFQMAQSKSITTIINHLKEIEGFCL